MSGRVLVGMSGGVDSSAAALLLQQQGYEVCGCTLRLHLDEPGFPPKPGGCCSYLDVQDARRVCYALGITHMVFNCTDLFGEKVVADFCAAYAAGRTPNPCIRCNRYLKFGAMLRRAQELGFDYIATGHYALVGQDPQSGRWQLRQSPSAKDQSYVLYSLTQEQLAHTLLPLGPLTKAQVRALAERAGLPVAHKPDSQDICFVPDNDYAGFLSRRGVAATPGDFVDQAGRVLGRHLGLIHYTVGQRKGLGIALGQPMYVLRLDPAKNQVVLGPEGSQLQSRICVQEMNWVSMPQPQAPLRVQVKIRYQARPAAALATPQADGSVRLHFDAPQRAPAPGQAAVLYSGDLLLGGGTIAAADSVDSRAR